VAQFHDIQRWRQAEEWGFSTTLSEAMTLLDVGSKKSFNLIVAGGPLPPRHQSITTVRVPSS